MRYEIQSLFHCTVIAWAEPTEDGERYEVIAHTGEHFVCDSLAMLISALSLAPRTRLAA